MIPFHPQKRSAEDNHLLAKRERACLTHRFFHLLGALPAQPLAASRVRRVLEVGCQIGTWANEFAVTHRGSRIVALDDDPLLLDDARRDACQRRISNVDYQHVPDLAGPFTLPEASFDLIHLEQPQLPYHAWPKLLEECVRLLRPGGWLCLVAWDQPMTNAPAWETFSHLTLQALEHAGFLRWQSERHTGLFCDLEPWCSRAGFEHRLLTPRWINFSFGAPDAEDWAETFARAYRATSLILEAGLATEQELSLLHHRRRWEMQLPPFHALWPVLFLWAEKPAEADERAREHDTSRRNGKKRSTESCDTQP